MAKTRDIKGGTLNVAALIYDRSLNSNKVLKGLEKRVYDRYRIKEILSENRLQDEQIVEDILRVVK